MATFCSTTSSAPTSIGCSPRARSCARSAAEYYPQLTAAFNGKHKDTELAVQDDVGLAVALTAGDTNELDILIKRRTIRYDWTAARKLLLEANELAQEAKRWIFDKEEQYSLLLVLFGIITQILSTIGNENHLATKERQDGKPPSKQQAKDIAVIAPQIASAGARLHKDAQRAGQLRYASGMALGTIALLVVSGVAAWVFAELHIRAANGVGLLAGGVGACISVLGRMTSDTFHLNYKAGSRMLIWFGGLRPFVGGVFGVVTFCVLKAGLIAPLSIPGEIGPQLAYVVVFAFAAGFNERFFQDVLAGASQGFSKGESATTAKEPNLEG